jgi:hypothetical protein
MATVSQIWLYTLPNSSAVAVLLGNGHRTFQPPRNISISLFNVSLVAGGVNGDGKPDLVAVGWPFGSANTNGFVLFGNGDGTFQAPRGFNVPANPSFIALGDFNLDNRADLVVVNSNTDSLSILLGNGDGTFRTPATAFRRRPAYLKMLRIMRSHEKPRNIDLTCTKSTGHSRAISKM